MNIREMMDEAQAQADAFEDEAIEAIKVLLPTGNVWPGRIAPPGCGLYAIWQPGQAKPLWVGQTEDYRQRFNQHIKAGRLNPRRHIITVYPIATFDEDHFRDLEAAAILALQPTLTKHVPFRRGPGPKLWAFIRSIRLHTDN